METITKFFDKRIAEANERFAGMTKAQRAVAIAGDAIWQVTSGSVAPITQIYFSPSYFRDSDDGCAACALGCLFAGIADHKRIDDVDDAYNPFDEFGMLTEKLACAFSLDESKKIEMAFEGHDPQVGLRSSTVKDKWYLAHDDLNDYRRFLRIAANIIHNKGKFVPAKDPSDAVFNRIIKKYGAKVSACA